MYHMYLVEVSQWIKFVVCQRTECTDHAQRGEPDVLRPQFRQCSQDYTSVDIPESADQGRDCKEDDKDARRNSNPFPADPFLEATCERGQHSVHSSSQAATT